jgi:hypothetical protein
MSTTTLYIELLIIGFEVCIWLGLLISLVLKDSCFAWLAELTGVFKDQSVLLLAAAFGVAYFFGIAVDKVARFCFGYDKLLALFQCAKLERLRIWLEAKDIEDETHPSMIYAQIMVNTSGVTGELLYGRSKVRILRASVLNVPLIAITAALFLRSSEMAKWWLALIVGLILTAIVAAIYLYTIHLYNRRLERFRHFMRKKKRAQRMRPVWTRLP